MLRDLAAKTGEPDEQVRAAFGADAGLVDGIKWVASDPEQVLQQRARLAGAIETLTAE